jgi:hypothetical protein
MENVIGRNDYFDGTARRKSFGVWQPVRRVTEMLAGRVLSYRFQRHWIPAFAGMTQPFPIAATLRVLLLDVCVI